MSKANDWQWCWNEFNCSTESLLCPLILGWAPNHFVLGAQFAPDQKRLVCTPARGFKNYIFAKKCIWSAFGFSNSAFFIPSHFIIVPNFSLWILDFSIPSVWIQIGPDKLFAKVISWQQKLPLVGKELNTKQPVGTIFWLNPWLKLISFGSNFFHLAKVLATTNSEPG